MLSKLEVNYSTRKKGQYYHHDLTIEDKVKGVGIKKIELPKSYKRRGLVLRNKDSEYVYYYYEKGQGRVHVIDLEFRKTTHQLETERLSREKGNKNFTGFASIDSNGDKLILQVGKGKTQKLIKIDAAKGEVVNQYDIGSKNIKVSSWSDQDLIWIHPLKKKNNNQVTFLNDDTMNIVSVADYNGKVNRHETYQDYLYLITEKNSSKKVSAVPHYSVTIINVKTHQSYTQYNSSEPPLLYIVGNVLYMVGQSIKTPKHLKVVKFINEGFIDISNKTIDMVVETVEHKTVGDKDVLMMFGDRSVAQFDIQESKKSIHIEVPFKVEGGIFSDDNLRVYLKAGFSAKIGLVDFEKQSFVRSQNTGSKGKKVGQALFSVLTAAATATTGYVIIPGIKRSKNALMLSKNQQWLYAINGKTDDITVFRASDLGTKTIHNVGKNIIQIVQVGHQKNVPVVVIANNQATFFDSETAEIIKRVKYDHFIEITDDLNLVYQVNNTQEYLSLY